MSEINEYGFKKPKEIESVLPEIMEAYKVAFSGDPWFEVSKCADPLKSCGLDYCRLDVGATSEVCGKTLESPAYEDCELIDYFEAIAGKRSIYWYLENTNGGVTLAAEAWKAEPSTLAQEKYNNVPEMGNWLETMFGDREVVWLDEVFANAKLKPSGNLDNFKSMCLGFMNKFESQVLAFRTINPAMTRAATRDFGDDAIVFNRYDDVPDRRDFVIITNWRNEL